MYLEQQGRFCNISVLGLILLMRHSLIIDRLEKPRFVNPAGDEKKFHGIHISCVEAESSWTPVWPLLRKWPVKASEIGEYLSQPFHSKGRFCKRRSTLTRIRNSHRN